MCVIAKMVLDTILHDMPPPPLIADNYDSVDRSER